MDVTVCVCVRDGAPYVDRCLAALLAETEAGAVPIVVVDHASRDDTAALLAAWERRHAPRLRVVRFDGAGLAAARDFAWRQAATAWVAFVDIDCAVQPGWARGVAEAIAVHAADPRRAAFGGTNRVAQDGRLLFRACAVLLATYVGGHNSILNRPVTARRQISHCPTLNVVYRRAALEQVQGFDAAYRRVSEDVELSRRLRAAGYTLWADPGPVVDHAARPSLAGWVRNVFLYGRGRTFHLQRHPEDFDVKFLAPPAAVLAYLAALSWDVVGAGGPSLFALLLLVHLGAVAVPVAAETRRQGGGWRVWAAATAVVWLTHLAYGAGFLFELPRRRDVFVP
ncbi:MAG: glycosyltransferase [Deltaproteobacteria bacterium]|nr:glycosyltransferase [Deltaproteobacteria bacterium]